jgi:hypothetical protein
MTATAAGQVTPILNAGGQIGNHVASSNRIYETVLLGLNGTKIVSVPKVGGTTREDVPAVAGEIKVPLIHSSNGLFYYTRFTQTATVTSSTTVALNESGTPVATFSNTGQVGYLLSAPFNMRGPFGTLVKVLVSTYVSGVLNGGTVTSVDAATGAATTTVGTVPSTTPNLASLAIVDSMDNAALGVGALGVTGNLAVFFMDSTIANSLVQVPVGPGHWVVVE